MVHQQKRVFIQIRYIIFETTHLSNYGIVATTLALDHYVNGSNKTVAKDFIAFLDSVSVPEDSLDFTTKELNAKIQDGK